MVGKITKTGRLEFNVSFKEAKEIINGTFIGANGLPANYVIKSIHLINGFCWMVSEDGTHFNLRIKTVEKYGILKMLEAKKVAENGK